MDGWRWRKFWLLVRNPPAGKQCWSIKLFICIDNISLVAKLSRSYKLSPSSNTFPSSLCHTQTRVDHICNSYLFFSSKLLIPLYYIRTDTTKNFRSIGGYLGVHQALQNIRPKYKGNGHNIGHKFLLVITFYRMHLSI